MERKTNTGTEAWDAERHRLYGEIKRLERAVSDAQQTLREQITEELEAKFDRKVKEARRLKAQVEEEFEAASEKWRAERRRLKEEIEKIEKGFSQRTEVLRKQIEEEFQADFDRRLEEAVQVRAELESTSKESEEERRRLQGEIDKLQRSLIEAIERSNNPVRETLAIRDRYESQLQEALILKTQLEVRFRTAHAEWEVERNNFVAEIERLKRGTPLSKEALRKQLTDRMRSRPDPRPEEAIAQLEQKHQMAKAQWEAEANLSRTRLEQEFQAAETRWEAERKELMSQIAAIQQAFTVAQEKLRVELTQQFQEQYEPKLVEALQQKAELERELAAVNEPRNEGRNFDSSGIVLSPEETIRVSAEIQNEIARMQGLITEISATIDDPSAPLTSVVRKNVERAELQAYLNGLQFAIGRSQARD